MARVERTVSLEPAHALEGKFFYGANKFCDVIERHLNVNESLAIVCGTYAHRPRKMSLLTDIINCHLSLFSLVGDITTFIVFTQLILILVSWFVRNVAILILFTQFITACHLVHTFPGEASWRKIILYGVN